MRFILLSIICLLVFNTDGYSCSMCKVTINGQTFLGNNEDSWRMGSSIWFENGSFGKLGAVYVGYFHGFPQGGMNEAGLAYDGLTTRPKPVKNITGKKSVKDPVEFLKTIMQNCKTVDEVYRYAIEFNRQQHFNQGEFLFADPSGNYLVMESDTIILGNDDKYIIANFCPSETPLKERLNWDRYKRGQKFNELHVTDTNAFNYTLALTDTMHECREKLGDGTMYSYVADLKNKEISLYFYHDFRHPDKYNLHDELAKGDRVVDMLSIFVANDEYKKLTNFKTPRTSNWMAAFLFGAGVFLFLFAVYFGIVFLRNIARKDRAGIVGIMIMDFFLVYYCFQLMVNESILYFPAPYREPGSVLLNSAAYLPFLCLLVMPLLLYKNVGIIKSESYKPFIKAMFTLNVITCLLLMGLFYYWGLYIL